MLNFAEQTGSGAVIVVWSFLLSKEATEYIINPFFSNTPVTTYHPISP